jgi:hypothetical protein
VAGYPFLAAAIAVAPEVKGGVPMGTFRGLPPEVLETLGLDRKATKTSRRAGPAV